MSKNLVENKVKLHEKTTPKSSSKEKPSSWSSTLNSRKPTGVSNNKQQSKEATGEAKKLKLINHVPSKHAGSSSISSSSSSTAVSAEEPVPHTTATISAASQGIKQIKENFANLFLSHSRFKFQSTQNLATSSSESASHHHHHNHNNNNILHSSNNPAVASSSSLSSVASNRLVVDEDLNLLKTIEYETNRNQELQKLKQQQIQIAKIHQQQQQPSSSLTTTAASDNLSTKKTVQSFQFLKSKPPLSKLKYFLRTYFTCYWGVVCLF